GSHFMETRYSPNNAGYQELGTKELRTTFLVESLFAPEKLALVYSGVARGIAHPTDRRRRTARRVFLRTARTGRTQYRRPGRRGSGREALRSGQVRLPLCGPRQPARFVLQPGRCQPRLLLPAELPRPCSLAPPAE